MLYHLFNILENTENIPGAGLFQYISFRAGLAIIVSLLISIIVGKHIIKRLQKAQVGETVRDLGLDGQLKKQGTPTMGGLIILLAILVPCLLLANLTNDYILLLLLATVWTGAIGYMDDYIKVFRKDKGGLKATFKIIGQVGLGVIVAVAFLNSADIVVRVPLAKAQVENYKIVEIKSVSDPRRPDAEPMEVAYVKSTITNVPFLKDNRFNYSDLLFFLGDNAKEWAWLVFLIVTIFIVTAVSNAANLTDGLDGLATGVSGIIAATLGIFAYLSGNVIAADYLNILYLPNSGEVVIFAACLVGACIGFLWYNAHPAQVFMGDTGSLMLGGVIAAMAILLRKEMLIPILCGIFLVESLSVMMQVGWFKYTRNKYGEGRRIFLMSPIHHHFQKAGMYETKIVVRFWIVAILLAVLTIITLKIR